MDQSWQIGTPHTLLVALEEARSEQTRFGNASIIKDLGDLCEGAMPPTLLPCPLMTTLCLSLHESPCLSKGTTDPQARQQTFPRYQSVQFIPTQLIDTISACPWFLEGGRVLGALKLGC